MSSASKVEVFHWTVLTGSALTTVKSLAGKNYLAWMNTHAILLHLTELRQNVLLPH
jgi:hypothetical protein